MLTCSRRFAVTVGLAVLSISLVGPPAKVHALSTCSGTYTTNQTLTADIACDNQPGILLTSGADLDLAGHGITCNGNCPQYAIQIAASGSVVKSTTGAGFITGAFTWAINCNNFSGSEITGIHFAMFQNGLLNCAKVHNNLVEGSRGTSSIG